MSEFPDTAKIKELAKDNLPEFIKVNNAFMEYGDSCHDDANSDLKEWELFIDYEMKLSEAESIKKENMDKFQKWSKLLQKSIRRDWPKETIRIVFKERNK